MVGILFQPGGHLGLQGFDLAVGRDRFQTLRDDGARSQHQRSGYLSREGPGPRQDPAIGHIDRLHLSGDQRHKIAAIHQAAAARDRGNQSGAVPGGSPIRQVQGLQKVPPHQHYAVVQHSAQEQG
ncbi:MAG: hypothetical protein ACK559_10655, partial [bacterium]